MLPDVTNLIPEVSEEVAIEQAPVEGGQGESIEATPEATDEAPAFDEADLLDTSELGDRMVKLTVDGEDVVVPLSEALNGYNSNSAATKRFQEAATLKEEAAQARAEAQGALNLAQAVTNDPGMTMQVLAKQAGLTVEQFLGLTPQQQHSVAAASEPEPEFADPLEKALYEERQARVALESRISAQEEHYERQRANDVLSRSVGDLQSQYGATPEDTQMVVRQAFEMKVGPEFFPMIYQAQQFQKSQATASAQQDAAAASAAETAARQAAAASASATIGTGTGAVGTAPAQVVQPMTAEDAIRSTLEQLGVN